MFNAYDQEPLFVSKAAPTERIDWGVHLIGAPEIWKKTKGEGVKVAVLDTGVDYNHQDLKIAGGCNFTTADQNDFMDRQGHGTHCSGIIAGTDNDIGVIGVAPDVELYMGKVLGDNGSGDLRWVMSGIDWAVQNGMDIISMSLGCESQPPEAYHEIIQYACRKGVIIIAAAGNEAASIGWPAAYPETLSVGAIDTTETKASFSNFGDGLDVVAPGVNIYSTYPGNRYALLSGTSMATPMVTGAIALLVSYAKTKGIKYNLQDIRNLLHNTCIDLGPKGKDQNYGWGLIDVRKLLEE